MTADPKPPARVRDPVFVRQFRLERIGEPCEVCERRTGVHVHHARFRSQGGSDTEDNLLWLCLVCHGEQHGINVVLS